jgi:hypothetical protein
MPDADGIQRQGAKPPRRNRISFYYETRKPGIIKKISWFPGFLMELFLVASLRLCVKSLLPGGRSQGPGQKANGQRMAGPGPDWPALPELERACG